MGVPMGYVPPAPHCSAEDSHAVSGNSHPCTLIREVFKRSGCLALPPGCPLGASALGDWPSSLDVYPLGWAAGTGSWETRLLICGVWDSA